MEERDGAGGAKRCSSPIDRALLLCRPRAPPPPCSARLTRAYAGDRRYVAHGHRRLGSHIVAGTSGNRAPKFPTSTVTCVQEPSLGLGAQGGRGGASGIDGTVHSATGGGDIESGPTDHHHDHREEEQENNKLMDKLSKFILTLVAGVSLPGARSTAMRFNRAAAIFLLTSSVTSLACVACTHLRLRRQWRRALVCASCASFVLVASLFLASLDLLLFAAVASAAVIIVVTITAVAMGSAAVDGDDGDDGGQSGPGGHLMVRIFDNCALYVTGGLVGLFFGSNYSNYLMK
uniref:Uncharacterized protein n=1 Tax=Oryza punctata TaxID=4537 RepID=A0A0E0LSB6_ORYPU